MHYKSRDTMLTECDVTHNPVFTGVIRVAWAQSWKRLPRGVIIAYYKTWMRSDTKVYIGLSHTNSPALLPKSHAPEGNLWLGRLPAHDFRGTHTGPAN